MRHQWGIVASSVTSIGAVQRSSRRERRSGSASWSTGDLLPQTSPAVTEPHLDACLGELCALSQLLPGVDVRVLSAFEGPLQFVELDRGEGGAWSSLLSLERDSRFTVAVRHLLAVWGRLERALGSYSRGITMIRSGLVLVHRECNHWFVAAGQVCKICKRIKASWCALLYIKRCRIDSKRSLLIDRSSML